MKDQEKDKKVRYNSLNIDGTKYRTIVPESYKHRPKYKETDPMKILSFIPGTITKIHVKEGQRVRKGTRLLTLEAMKMKNRIEAPMNCMIKKIIVNENDIVPKNQLLIELE